MFEMDGTKHYINGAISHPSRVCAGVPDLPKYSVSPVVNTIWFAPSLGSRFSLNSLFHLQHQKKLVLLPTKMKLWTVTYALAGLCATMVAASPTDFEYFDTSFLESRDLMKRYSCGNGIAVDCGGASISCSSECRVCCGDCCKTFPGESDSCRVVV